MSSVTGPSLNGSRHADAELTDRGDGKTWRLGGPDGAHARFTDGMVLSPLRRLNVSVFTAAAPTSADRS